LPGRADFGSGAINTLSLTYPSFGISISCIATVREPRGGSELHERTAHPTASAPTIVLERVKQYALAHLTDPDLSAAQIADAHHMSVRYVHKLFEADGMTAGT
jgi:hypothetical protein